VRRVAIVGAGGHGREVLDVVEAINRAAPTFEVVGFVADRVDDEVLARRGAAHLGSVDDLASSRIPAVDAGVDLVLAVGDPTAREALVRALAPLGPTWASALVHPLASIGSDVALGDGTVVAAGARITTNVRVGCHVQVNVNAVISHDCTVADHATLSPGVLVNGAASIGAGALLGTGAVVTPGRTVGEWAVVGAGAVVVSDVPAGVTAIGVPARWRT
jgi:sugar O-acyltransferase (sialic acid O-acetyltransferase NeuD family)